MVSMTPVAPLGRFLLPQWTSTSFQMMTNYIYLHWLWRTGTVAKDRSSRIDSWASGFNAGQHKREK